MGLRAIHFAPSACTEQSQVDYVAAKPGYAVPLVLVDSGAGWSRRIGMKGQKMAVWIAVGIAVGVAIGTAMHAMAIWMCIGVVAGAAIGAVVGRR